jgi:hypothetical protein
MFQGKFFPFSAAALTTCRAGLAVPTFRRDCESVFVGVLLECFKLGDDVKMLDLIVGRIKERLAKARLGDLETKGSG